MFRLNKIQKTKSGESLKPFTVNGDTVYCFDKLGNTIMRNISEFDFTSDIKPKKIKSVVPILEEPEITEVTETKNSDELYAEEEYIDLAISDDFEEIPPTIEEKPTNAFVDDDDYI